MNCPLCKIETVRDYWRDGKRTFYQCPHCSLVFVPPSQFLSEAEEKKRYDLHQNSPDDAGYRAFLGRLFAPLQNRLLPRSSGLDFGSGPEPVLASMFREAGHSVTLYDRYYEPEPKVLERRYDFITACEVVEHLRYPGLVLEQVWNCLKPGGLLGIMTQFTVGRDEFPAWHYKNDLTHICFFSQPTFAWLGGQWRAELTSPRDGVVVFRKR